MHKSHMVNFCFVNSTIFSTSNHILEQKRALCVRTGSVQQARGLGSCVAGTNPGLRDASIKPLGSPLGVAKIGVTAQSDHLPPSVAMKKNNFIVPVPAEGKSRNWT